MGLFTNLYNRVMGWAAHPHAPYYLAGLSFAEASFFPIPPDVMLAPLSLAKPKSAWRYAALATGFSVLGGVLGYYIGNGLQSSLTPYLQQWGYWSYYQTAVSWFDRWGVGAVLLAGFSPIPYKIFTISAGAMKMSLLPFVAASLLGRAMRFFLVSGLMVLGGERLHQFLKRTVDWIGWIMVLLVVSLYGYLQVG